MKALTKFETIEQARAVESKLVETFNKRLGNYFTTGLQENLWVEKFGNGYVIRFKGYTSVPAASIDGLLGHTNTETHSLLTIHSTKGVINFLNLVKKIGWTKYTETRKEKSADLYWSIRNEIEDMQQYDASIEGISFDHFVSWNYPTFLHWELFEE